MCDTFGRKNTFHKQRHIFRAPADFPVVLVCVVAFQCVDHMNKGTRNNTVGSSAIVYFLTNDREISVMVVRRTLDLSMFVVVRIRKGDRSNK